MSLTDDYLRNQSGDIMQDIANARRHMLDDLFGPRSNIPPWFRIAVAKVRYKPGYTFEIMGEFDPQPGTIGHLLIKAKLPNSRSKEQELVLIASATAIPTTFQHLPEDEARQYFFPWLRSSIRGMEDHELDEWFSYDGELVNDPHAPKEASNAAAQ